MVLVRGEAVCAGLAHPVESIAGLGCVLVVVRIVVIVNGSVPVIILVHFFLIIYIATLRYFIIMR